MYGFNRFHNPGVHDIYPMRKNNKNIPKPVIMSWHDRSNLLEMQSALTFQLSLGIQHLNRLTGRLRAWMEAKQNSAHSNTDDKNTSLFDRTDTLICLHTCKWTHEMRHTGNGLNTGKKMEDVRIIFFLFCFCQSCKGKLWVCVVSYSFDGLKWSVCII